MKLDIIYNEDCLVGMKKLPDESIDLIATDPQYGWGFMGKDWDKAVPTTDIWQQCFRVLKSGAFAFIMSGPRLDCLIENGMRIREAGFMISFTPIFWTYASGFPKAQNISLNIDKQECKKQLIAKLGRKPKKEEFDKVWHEFKEIEYHEPFGREHRSKIPTGSPFESPKQANKLGDGRIPYHKAVSLQAKILDGSYGGFQPKPAVEIIIVAMKPLSEKTYVDQALKSKKGITWLDKGRIPYKNEKDDAKRERIGGFRGEGIYSKSKIGIYVTSSGRFPANLLVSDDVLNDGRNRRNGGQNRTSYRETWLRQETQPTKFANDSGSFSRYFDLDKWFEEKIKQLPAFVQKTFPFLIVPKASKSEKNRGCAGLKEKQGLEKCLEPLSDPRMNRKQKRLPNRNYHPTVKPLKLMSYLITLGSRKGDIVLDPFIGSGTTAIAAIMLGRHHIGFEINSEYYEIAKKRLSEVQLELIK